MDGSALNDNNNGSARTSEFKNMPPAPKNRNMLVVRALVTLFGTGHSGEQKNIAALQRMRRTTDEKAMKRCELEKSKITRHLTKMKTTPEHTLSWVRGFLREKQFL